MKVALTRSDNKNTRQDASGFSWGKYQSQLPGQPNKQNLLNPEYLSIINAKSEIIHTEYTPNTHWTHLNTLRIHTEYTTNTHWTHTLIFWRAWTRSIWWGVSLQANISCFTHCIANSLVVHLKKVLKYYKLYFNNAKTGFTCELIHFKTINGGIQTLGP